MGDWKKLFENQSKIPLIVKSFWFAGKWRASRGLVDSWAISLAAGMRSAGYKSIIPPVNLVSNNGHDVHATHTDANSPGILQSIERLPDPYFKYLDTSPELIKENNKYLEVHRYKISSRNYLSPPIVMLELLISLLMKNFDRLRSNSKDKNNIFKREN